MKPVRSRQTLRVPLASKHATVCLPVYEERRLHVVSTMRVSVERHAAIVSSGVFLVYTSGYGKARARQNMEKRAALGKARRMNAPKPGGHRKG